MLRQNCTLYFNFCPLGKHYFVDDAVASGYSWPIVMLITLINSYWMSCVCQMKTPPDRAGIIFEVGAQLEARERHKKWSGAHRHYR